MNLVVSVSRQWRATSAATGTNAVQLKRSQVYEVNDRWLRGSSMKFKITLPNMRLCTAILISLLVFLGHTIRTNAQTNQTKDQPYVVEYYYKAKWGYAEEFLRLFKKNHYPFLRKVIETGRVLQVTAAAPVYHTTEDGRWDYRVTIVWKNVQAAFDSGGEDQILKQLYPDQETFKREEQRRFEILLAHWDVPVKRVNLDEK
jgi:hypothetical protein